MVASPSICLRISTGWPVDKNLFWRPTIAIHSDSAAWIVSVIAVPTRTVIVGGIDAGDVRIDAGGVVTRVNSEAVSLLPSVFDR